MKSISDYKVIKASSICYDISPLLKRLRASAIRDYMQENGFKSAVCFSSGRALEELRKVAVPVLGISVKDGDMLAMRWFSKEEIRYYFPNCFDATSGHLPLLLCDKIAAEVRANIEGITAGTEYRILSGSGECAYIFHKAFPEAKTIPVFDQREQCTEWNAECEFNLVLKRYFARMEIIGSDGILKELGNE